MKGPITRVNAFARWIILVLLVGFAVPVLAQNTKGEKPVSNKGQIRETKSKTVRRKDKSKTRDIAGRRLRTKDKSSANSANVGIRQPNPYAKRPRTTTDRAAKPRVRTYAESPSERPRAPKGDISGHRLRTKRPQNSDAASPNVYTEPRYLTHGATTPRTERPPRYKSTGSGQPLVHRIPQQKERAWTGDLKGKPSAPRSVTAQRQNTFPQDKTYKKYVDKKVARDRAVSNQREVSKTARMSHPPRTTGGGGGGYPASVNKGFVQRGRKNVYWGKFHKGEKPFTRDITGAPLRQKNYRSPGAGLVGRDTLKHFGNKPGGDVNFAGRRPEGVSVGKPYGQKGWRGDISGTRLRRLTPSNRQVAGQNVFPRRLSATRFGEHVGRPIGYATFSDSRGGETVGKRLPGKPPGIGGLSIASDMRKTKGKGKKDVPGSKNISGFSGHMQSGKNFVDQGEGFSGYIKARKPFKGGGSVSGLWNNNGTAIAKKGIPGGATKVAGYPGHIQSSKNFQDQGGSFTGYLKARKPLKGGGSVSGKLWNNQNSAITQRTLPRSADKPVSFSGTMYGGKTFQDLGGGFTGYIKASKPLKGGGSVSGKLWNNRNSPIDRTVLPGGAEKPARFAGNIQGGKTFKPQGEDFTGYLKAKKPVADAKKPSGFAGSLKLDKKNMEVRGGTFAGNVKAKKPKKGGGESISADISNNQGESITELDRSGATRVVSDFSGKSKRSSSKPSTSGFDSKGKFTMKEDFTQSPKAVDASTKKHTPDRDGFRIEGMRVKVEREKVTDREHTVSGALRGVGPSRSTVSANEYASGARSPERRHNPNSADEAMRGYYHGGKATARLGSFQGNMKMKKSGDHSQPDARFAQGTDNNVDDERTILTNMKLLWAKLFNKSGSQPNHVKEKERRPRYDKGEIGMWAE